MCRAATHPERATSCKPIELSSCSKYLILLELIKEDIFNEYTFNTHLISSQLAECEMFQGDNVVLRMERVPRQFNLLVIVQSLNYQ